MCIYSKGGDKVIIHFSMSKPAVPQGVSTVVDMLGQCLPKEEHLFYRAKGNNNNSVKTTSENKAALPRGVIDKLKFFKSFDLIYVFFMLYSSLKIVLSARNAVKADSVCISHDIFCLFWLAILRRIHFIPKCKISLYNHSDGHPIDTLKHIHSNFMLRPLYGLIGLVVNNMDIFTVYSLSDIASDRIKVCLRKTHLIRFLVVFNYVKSVDIGESDWEIKNHNIWLIGSVCERKGQITFFENIVNLVKGKSYNLTFNILGPCSEKDKEKLKTFNFVNYLGIHSNVRTLLFPEDICLSVSSNEGLPMSLIEGASKGCIIISTDVGGCKEICNNYVNGYLLPSPFNAEELLNKIVNLVANEEELSRLSKNSLELFNEKFSENCSVKFWRKEVENIYYSSRQHIHA
jgi:glycosyltransferase involved in cell wall biosynthesis